MLTSVRRDVQHNDAAVTPEVASIPRRFRFVVRVLAEHKNDQWQAFSLELGLAAQADTLPEVKYKLESMIRSYLDDALVGEDREHAYDLLFRRATWQVFAKYHWASVISHLGTLFGRSKDRVIYDKTLPLAPRFC
jgi:hypothetical protein